MQDLRITLIQANQVWHDKSANLKHFTECIDQLSAPTDLIILPEMFATGFSMQATTQFEEMHGMCIQWMIDQAQKMNTFIMGSLIIKENKKYFNRLLIVSAQGVQAHYDKRHLFRMADEHKTYTPGDKLITFNINGWKIRPFICYDLRFPVWSRNTYSEQGGWSYDLAIYVANWPAVRAYPWKTLAIARAIENQSYVATLNRVGKDANGFDYFGNSQVIDSYGTVLMHLEKDEIVRTMTLDAAQLAKHRRDFPVGMDADHFGVIL